MRPQNDGSTIVLTQERYLQLLSCEMKIQMIESARQTSKGYEFDRLIDAMFPAPKEEKPNA